MRNSGAWGAVGAAMALALTGALPDTAHAGAFQLNERSTKALGAGLAGASSARSDVTFAGYNPAALSLVTDIEAGFNASFVSATAKGRDSLLGLEVQPGKAAFVPAGAFGWRLSPEIVVGFTNYSPFGLATKYPSNWVGQADGVTSQLRTISFSPTVAVSPVDWLHLGASFNLLYADARLTSTATRLDADDTAFSFSVGAQVEPVDGTTIGLAYHHGYDVSMTGTQSLAAQFGGLTGGQADFPLTASAELPATLQAGITQELGEDLRLMLEGRYVFWSAFDRIDFTSPGAPNASNFGAVNFGNFNDPQNYDDAFFIAGGAEYDVVDELTIRGGISFDQTPTNDAFRTVRVPDADRLWLSAGATWNISDTMSVDMAYNFLTMLDDPVVTLRNGRVAGQTVTYDANVHVISIGASLKF